MPSLDQARIAIKQSDKATAKIILVELVTHEPQNAAAWSLLAEVLDDPQQISFCRQRAQSLVRDEPPNTKPVEPTTPDAGQTRNSDLKKCPYCAETIRAEAIVCRFCGRDLQTGQALSIAIPTQSAEPQSLLLDRKVGTLTNSGWQVINRTSTTAQLRKPKQWNSGCLGLCVLLLLGGFFLPALFGVAVVGLIIAVLDYLLKKEETAYYTEEHLGQEEQRRLDEQRSREEQKKRDEQARLEHKREEKRRIEEEHIHTKQLERGHKPRMRLTKQQRWLVIGFVIIGVTMLIVTAFYILGQIH
ncbi:MAG: hypothetical protein JXA21_03865 [Anaerolineae bacterium]|nr:hypothetical protein [Anaerolineae bacterium]